MTVSSLFLPVLIANSLLTSYAPHSSPQYVNGDVVLEDDVLIGPHCVLTSNSHKFNPERQSFRGMNENKAIVIGVRHVLT